jgi:hypothetical protein
MHKIGWVSIIAASGALAACGTPVTEAPDQQPTEAPSSDPARTTDPAAPDQAASTSRPTASEDGRPPLDNSAAQAEAGSCLAELGREKAEELSEQCYAMSPATRPPCNIQNSCERIRAELKRGCNFGDTSDNPDYCSEV